MRILKSSYFQFFVFLILGCILSSYIQNETLWDFTNYHFYNPWAFLENRVGYDIAVGGGNTYFNPLIDVPFFLLIKYFNGYPSFVLFLQGIPLGALLFVFFKMNFLFFDTKDIKGKISIGAALVIALTSWTLFSQIGSSTNEITISFFVLWAFYLIMKNIISPETDSHGKIFYAGLLMGATLGLKLTAIIYCLSSALLLLFFASRFKCPLKVISFYVLGGVSGFVITHGYWSWVLWDLFKNPVFPFANGIFKSPWFVQENFRDTTFLPQGLFQYLFYPFYVASFKLRTVENLLIADYRYIIMFVVTLMYGGKFLYNHFCKKKHLNNISLRVLLWAFLLSYVAWLLIFAIMRYDIVILMFASVIIVKAFYDFFPKKIYVQVGYISVWIVIAYSLLGTPYYSDIWENRKKKDATREYFINLSEEDIKKDEKPFKKLVEIEKLNVPDNTLFLMYNLPSSAFLPLLGSNIRAVLMKQFNYVSTEGDKKQDLFDTPIWHKLKEEIISKHKGSILTLISYSNLTEFWYHKNILFDKNTYCRSLRNNIHPVYLCVPHSEVKNIFVEKASGEEILNGYTEE